MSAVLRMSTACLSSLRTGFEQAGSVTSLLAAMVSLTFPYCPAVYMCKPHARNTILQDLYDVAQGREPSRPTWIFLTSTP